MNKNKSDSRQIPHEKKKGEMSEAEIDEILKDSFPASDPPSWTLGTNHIIKTDEETVRNKRHKE